MDEPGSALLPVVRLTATGAVTALDASGPSRTAGVGLLSARSG